MSAGTPPDRLKCRASTRTDAFDRLAFATMSAAWASVRTPVRPPPPPPAREASCPPRSGARERFAGAPRVIFRDGNPTSGRWRPRVGGPDQLGRDPRAPTNRASVPPCLAPPVDSHRRSAPPQLLTVKTRQRDDRMSTVSVARRGWRCFRAMWDPQDLVDARAVRLFLRRGRIALSTASTMTPHVRHATQTAPAPSRSRSLTAARPSWWPHGKRRDGGLGTVLRDPLWYFDRPLGLFGSIADPE
jgi:hypothetical protein